MDPSEQHEMQLSATYSSGAEEWYCPTCRRRILLNVPPNGDMIILETGDTQASHSGSRGGLRFASVTQEQCAGDDVPVENLGSWMGAIEDLDLNW